MNNDQKFDEVNFMKHRTATQAFKLSEEINDILHDKESGCYKPWQFSSYKVERDTLKTTYEEIVLWGSQEAMIRPGFKVGVREIVIPNLFSKINGVHEDIKQYREEINQLLEEENVLFFKKFPLYKKRYKKAESKAYFNILNLNGELEKNRLLSSDSWRYKTLNPVLQEKMADLIIEFCRIPYFWKHRNFKTKLRLPLINRIMDIVLMFLNTNERDEKMMKVSTFVVLNNLDKELIEILKSFDYPMKVPKIVIYNNNKGKHMSYADALTLMFMNALGIDIVIFNPAGASDIENYVKEEYYDIHRLEEYRNNLPYRKNGILYRLSHK